MGPYYTQAELATIRTFVFRQRRDRDKAVARKLLAARRDCRAIARVIARAADPVRIYVWGSLVDTVHFSELSDIDIAVEGVPAPARLYELLGRLQSMTRFALDLVRIESVHPVYAEYIRRRGKIAYERPARR